ncbi:MAG: M15 family metallopeptidase [Clostridia bacterium]|nr:M15 family metallopeptidase [Clostridia bacterium]
MKRNEAPGATSPRRDRREIYLYEERERQLREAADARRREAERLEAEAAAARRAAEREERRRREAERRIAAKRREDENLMRYEAEKRRLAEERRRREIEEKRAKAARIEKLRRRRHRKRVIKYHIGIFAASLLIFLAIGVLAGYGLFYKDTSDRSRSVTYYYDGKKELRSDKSAAYCNGELCVDFMSVAEHFGFYYAGDKDGIKFVIPDSATKEASGSIEFIIGSSCAVVNGTPVSLSAPARYIGSSLWVSADVMSLFDGGIEMKASAGRVDVSRVQRVDANGKKMYDGNDDPIYEDYGLYYEDSPEPAKVDLVALYGDAAKGLGKGSAVSFKSDLSAYEEYMNPIDSNEYLVLVNSENPLDASYLPGDLEDVADTKHDGRATVRLRLYVARSLAAMFSELRAAGYEDVAVTSGFVSYNEQAYMFNTAVTDEMTKNELTEEEAKTAVRAYLDEAGECDLQAGLTAVIHDLDEASTEFANRPAYEWLSENAWKFGFIERYPKGKENITGHNFDPCSFRYVGRFAAEIIHRNGWCLEEYLLNSAN